MKSGLPVSLDEITKSSFEKYDVVFKRLGAENLIEEKSLLKEDVSLIHDLLIEKYGGICGVRDNNLFESVCINPYGSSFGVDFYPTVFDKAAKYMFDFSNYQVFLDGNKRTGTAIATVMLEYNGYTLKMSPKELYDLSMDIANHRISEVSQVSEILEKNSDLGKYIPYIDEDKMYDSMTLACNVDEAYENASSLLEGYENEEAQESSLEM